MEASVNSVKVGRPKYPPTHWKQAKFNELVTNWVIKDGVNFNAVSREGFQEMITGMDEQLSIPDRGTVANNIRRKYQQVRNLYFHFAKWILYK